MFSDISLPEAVRAGVLSGIAGLYSEWPVPLQPSVLEEILRQRHSQARLHMVHSLGLRKEHADVLTILLHDTDPMIRGCSALSLARTLGEKSRDMLQTSYAEASNDFERALVLCGSIMLGDARTQELHVALCALADEAPVWKLMSRWRREFLTALSADPEQRLGPAWSEALRLPAPTTRSQLDTGVRQASPSSRSIVRNLIFLSYSQLDKKHRDEFLTMFRPAAEKHGLKIWSDQDIPPGVRWRTEIENALARAKIGVLLVSKDFLNSSFIQSNELPPLLKASQEDGTRIFWIACRPSGVLHTEIGTFQCANNPAKPLSSLDKAPREQELQRICDVLLHLSSAVPPSKE
jgi:TIR domain